MKNEPESHRLHPVLSFRINKELKDALEAVAAADRRPVSQWIKAYLLDAMREIIEEQKKAPPLETVKYVRKQHVRRRR